MEEINTLMEQLYQGHPQFSTGGRDETVIVDMDRVQRQISNGNPQMTTRCQEMEGTMVLHKTIHHSRIMLHLDKEKEAIIYP